MSYTINPNAKNRWARNAENTMDLSLETDASSVYLDNSRTLEQEIGEGSMVSNVATIDNGMEKVIDGTYDGAYESCKMYGKSLVNLFNSKQITPSLHFSSNNDGKYENIVKSNGLIEFDIVGSENPGNYQYINMGKVNVDLLKPNTRYLVLFEEITGIDTVSIRDGNSANTVIDYTKVGGKQYVILTTLSEWQKSNQILYLYVQSKTGIHVKVKNAMIMEYQEGMENWDLDYFERLCDVKAPILQNVGKNLFNIANHTENQWTFSNGYPYEQVNTYEDRLKILNNEIHFTTDGTTVNKGVGYYIPLCKNKDYTLNINKKSGNNFCVKVFLIHPSEKPLRQYIHDISRMPVNSEVINTKTFKANFNSTNYEMCAIYIGGGWENGATGTRSFVFNNISLTQSSDNTTHEPYKTNILETSNDLVLRGLPSGIRDTYDCLTGEYIRRVGERDYQESDESDSNVITDLVKTHYELAEPIVTQIEPPTTPFAYQNGHIILESGHEGQSLLPTLEYSTVINKTGQVENVAKTIQRQEKQLTMLEQMLIQNIINLDYNNTLLTLKNEMEEML